MELASIVKVGAFLLQKTYLDKKIFSHNSIKLDK